MVRTWRELIYICVAVACLAILASQILAAWLGFEKLSSWPTNYGSGDPAHPIFIGGSSLINYALDWEELSTHWSRPIRGMSTASASPCEIEILRDKQPLSDFTILGISIYEMNEHMLCDFRADIVPVTRTLRDLWESDANWSYIKRMLGTYALCNLRSIFPTAGRSHAVFVGMRDKLRNLLGKVRSDSDQNQILLKPTPSEIPTNTIREWSSGRALRNLTQMKISCQGKHDFNGPKSLAIRRMLNIALTQGRVVVMVLPVSPLYEETFVTKEVAEQFENALAAVQHQFPEVLWIRLDQLPEMHGPENYWDLVHLNKNGRSLAMNAVLSRIDSIRKSK